MAPTHARRPAQADRLHAETAKVQKGPFLSDFFGGISAVIKLALDRAKTCTHNCGMKIGYARVSMDEQTLALQLDALQADGCESVHEDHGYSDLATKRPGLAAALAALKPGDVLTVWRVDRLGRSTASLALLLDELHGQGVQFRSIIDGMDTSTASGRAVYRFISVMAQLERDLISERTRAGMKASRRRGIKPGRPIVLTPEKRNMALKLIEEGNGKGVVARMVGVSPATLRRALNESVAN